VCWRVASLSFDEFRINQPTSKDLIMSIGTILIIILILFLVGVFPAWPHSTNWGYYPSGGLGLILRVVVILILMGRL
jgi:hypothetical protein